LSSVIGRSRIRFPVAWNTAFCNRCGQANSTNHPDPFHAYRIHVGIMLVDEANIDRRHVGVDWRKAIREPRVSEVHPVAKVST
jgi:hypothetical protein